jgi:hypothetical protein
MRVGIIQSCFLPWRGYFDFIASVDLFVFHDDLQYTKGDWRNRNRIKTPKGTEWITVPVSHERTSQLICRTAINEATDWRRSHLNKWRAYYDKAEHFADVLELLDTMRSDTGETISELNIRLIRSICAYLGIKIPMLMSSELKPEGKRTERLINLLRAAGATSYLSGPSADAYLDKHLFEEAGIRLEYKSYDYAPYPQLWGPFKGGVSVLDLIANCGRASGSLMRSATPNRIVVP